MGQGDLARTAKKEAWLEQSQTWWRWRFQLGRRGEDDSDSKKTLTGGFRLSAREKQKQRDGRGTYSLGHCAWLGPAVAERGKRGEEERPRGVGPATGWASSGVEQARPKLRGKGGASRAGLEMREGELGYLGQK